MKKGLRIAEIAVLAVFSLCLLYVNKEDSDRKDESLSDGQIRELSWFSDMPLWYPEEWEKEPGSGTEK